MSREQDAEVALDWVLEHVSGRYLGWTLHLVNGVVHVSGPGAGAVVTAALRRGFSGIDKIRADPRRYLGHKGRRLADAVESYQWRVDSYEPAVAAPWGMGSGNGHDGAGSDEGEGYEYNGEVGEGYAGEDGSGYGYGAYWGCGGGSGRHADLIEWDSWSYMAYEQFDG